MLKQTSMQHQISYEDGDKTIGVKVVVVDVVKTRCHKLKNRHFSEDQRQEVVMVIMRSIDNLSVKFVVTHTESVNVQHTENIMIHVAKLDIFLEFAEIKSVKIH